MPSTCWPGESWRELPAKMLCHRMPNRLTCISLHHAGFNSFTSSTGLPHAPNQVDIHAPRLASFGLRHQSMATLGTRRERGAARPERHPPSRRLTVLLSLLPLPFPPPPPPVSSPECLLRLLRLLQHSASQIYFLGPRFFPQGI